MPVELKLLVLTLCNWLHLAATVVWFGSMSTNMLVLLPSMKQVLDPPVMGKLMGLVMKRLRNLVYLSAVTLGITGMIMTKMNKHFIGPMRLENLWSVITHIKHLVIVALIILVVYAFENLGRKVMQLAVKGPSPELANLQKRQMQVASIGFVLAILVLLITAWMTAISSSGLI